MNLYIEHKQREREREMGNNERRRSGVESERKGAGLSLFLSLSGAFKKKLCVLFFKFSLFLVPFSSSLHVFISVTREMRTWTRESVRLEFLMQVILKL